MQERLEAVLDEHEVTGAAFAILRGDEVTVFAAGCANTQAGIDVTPDTLFQIGSISKVWTATLVMMLVDEGVLDLDVPVITYLPEFKVADPNVTARVTLRDLLSHRSGIGGDHIIDTGRGDDNLERYVASCADIGQEHELGATMSYCNTGYSVIGRVIEKVTGTSWDSVLRRRLIRPLGLTHTNTLPEEAILFRAAVGHDHGNVMPMWALPRSAGPAGLINARAADVLAFAKLHLADGRAPDGTQLISAASVKAMQEPQIDVPDKFTLGDRWGLGWILFDWNGTPGYGHDGTTVGQRAFLRVAPGAGVAVCMLSTGGNASAAFRELSTEVLRDIAGIEVPPIPQPTRPPITLDLARYEGAYARLNAKLTFVRDGDRLLGYVDNEGPLAAALYAHKTPDEIAAEREKNRLELTPVDESLFIATGVAAPLGVPVVFFEFDGATPNRVHFGARAMKRATSA